ncbi:unnamed protein product, partial [Allacma fusca]
HAQEGITGTVPAACPWQVVIIPALQPTTGTVLHASTTTWASIAPNFIIGMGILANVILGPTHVFPATTGTAQHALISAVNLRIYYTPLGIVANWGGCDVRLSSLALISLLTMAINKGCE